MVDRYGSDVLSGDWKKPPRGRSEEVVVERGMIVVASSTIMPRSTTISSERPLGGFFQSPDSTSLP